MTKKQKALSITTIILVCVGVAFGLYWFYYGQYFQKTDDAYVKGNIITISSRLSGHIVEVYAKNNMMIKAGSPLFSLDDNGFKVLENKALAGLKQQKAQLISLDAKRQLDQDNIAQAKAKIAQAKAKLENDMLNQKRIALLINNNYASQAQFDEINQTVKSDKAALNAVNASYKSAQDQVYFTDAQIKQAQASIAEAQASLNQAKLNRSYSIVKAPQDGIITNRSAEKGMNVSPGMPLFSLVPLNDLWVIANFKETQLKNIRLGQPVTIYVDAYGDKAIKGVIESISPGSGSEFALLPQDNATGNFTKVVQRFSVKIKITSDIALRNKLYPGLSVEVVVDTHSTK